MGISFVFVCGFGFMFHVFSCQVSQAPLSILLLKSMSMNQRSGTVAGVGSQRVTFRCIDQCVGGCLFIIDVGNHVQGVFLRNVIKVSCSRPV